MVFISKYLCLDYIFIVGLAEARSTIQVGSFMIDLGVIESLLGRLAQGVHRTYSMLVKGKRISSASLDSQRPHPIRSIANNSTPDFIGVRTSLP